MPNHGLLYLFPEEKIHKEKRPLELATIQDVSRESGWQNGHDWTRLDVSMFPVKTIHEVKLNSSDMKDMKKEMMIIGGTNENVVEFDWPHQTSNHGSYATLNVTGRCVPNEVVSRYEFSKYILDPNRHRFRIVVRIIAIVKRFIKNFIKKYHKRVQPSSEQPEAN